MISKYTHIHITAFVVFVLALLVVQAEPLLTSGELLVNADAIENHYESDVAIANNGSFVVTWQSTDDNVYFRQFDASGTPLSNDVIVNQTLTSESFHPAISMDDSGNFVISWTMRLGGDLNIYARRYNNAGTPLGDEFLVNTTTTQSQASSAIAVASDGRFVITWSGRGTRSDNDDIVAQMYNASGNPVGSEFIVNTSAVVVGQQSTPQISIADSGEFFICWNSRDQDGALFGAYARRFASDGTPNSAEFLVNDQTDGNEGCYDVSMSTTGNAIIVYSRRAPLASNTIMYAKRYDNTGNQVGSRFELTNDAPSNAQVELSDDGTFFVGWVSSANGLDVEGQAFASDNSPDGISFTISENTNEAQVVIAIAMNNDGQIVSTWTSSHIMAGSPDVFARTILLDTPEVTFEVASSNDVEGNSIDVNVNLIMGSNIPYSSVTIPLIYSGTSDTSDYFNAPVSITFNGLSANTTYTETISIDLIDDGVSEGAETIIIDLDPSLPTKLGTIPQHTINIDDQSASVVTIYANDSSAAENPLDDGQYTIDLGSINNTATAINITYAVTGTATSGVDYVALSGNVIIPDGQQVGTINLIPLDDANFDPTETVILTLTGTDNIAFSVDNTAATVIINDNEIIVQANETRENSDAQNNALNIFDPAISKIGFLVPGQSGIIGEQLEWVVTVSNTGNAVGNNVTVTDTLIDALQIDSVDAPNATVNINGQTVSVTYPTLQVGETVQFSIFTTVLDGVEVNNTACVDATNQNVEECVSATAVSQLPSTGEIPIWHNLLLIIGLTFMGFTSLFLVKLNRKMSQ